MRGVFEGWAGDLNGERFEAIPQTWSRRDWLWHLAHGLEDEEGGQHGCAAILQAIVEHKAPSHAQCLMD